MKVAFRWMSQIQLTTLNREEIASSIHHKSENVSRRMGKQAEALTANGERQWCLRKLILFKDVSENASSCSTSLLLLCLINFFPPLYSFAFLPLYHLTGNLSSVGASCLLEAKGEVAWRVILTLLQYAEVPHASSYKGKLSEVPECTWSQIFTLV